MGDYRLCVTLHVLIADVFTFNNDEPCQFVKKKYVSDDAISER